MAQSLISPGELSADGSVTRQGYRYALFLPDAAGTGLVAHGPNLANIDSRHAETTYTILAWPSVFGQTGRSCFFVNQQGTILRSTTADYSGDTNPPPAGAGLVGVPPDTIVGGRLAAGQVGTDGNRWVTVQ